MTTPATEIIRCPTCRHLLRVPQEWLGTAVQCPECRTQFQAPVRLDGGLSEPVVLQAPARAAAASPPPDNALYLPAYGLLVCGIAGLIVNLAITWRLHADPEGSREYIRGQVAKLREYGFGADDPEELRDQLDEARTAQAMRHLPWVVPAAAVAAALALLGGLSIALRWNYRLAQLGCIAAAFNLVGLCCLPGALVGLWALLLMQSAEGRGHFGLPPA